ncbi:flagellar basal-body MS-ring/collar protein FliF [Desulfovibrio litoralis]|uniref:Flagellar M-ring protein n=1 Tax=Desulfovibrio litoralis DSM 11393 TaxID=1121455 RepID=A0A1M7SDK2_9BACT|nr:flagellar basal-body MS-ring/collar protein FliF [Desulfovibrio litoralis]SHN56538.1 flagellar M-ring protein FliF [Desulfovibrio litoralis DSM 11393]
MSFNTVLEQLKNFWSRFTTSQRFLISFLAVAFVVAFAALVWWVGQPDYQVLYSNLAQEDAGRIVKVLQAEKVSYRLENGGTTISVPSNLVYETRLKIAGEGTVQGQGVGFEIFNDVKVGQTDFIQKINYQRALQGELARTISEFPSVESARVHLVIPRRSLFVEEKLQPSASVVIKLREGSKIDPKEVQAIVNLVTMSVEGMDRNRITVADSGGRILFEPAEDGSLVGTSSTQLDHRLSVQQSIERRIEEMLTPIIGQGKVIAKVNADLDFSQRTFRKELFDPDKTVVRSEQRSEESTQGQSNLNAGVPETNFRGDGLGNGQSNQASNRESRTTNFEINKEEQSIVGQVGEITRLSVAVIVDGVYNTNPDTNETVFSPRSDEEMKRIKSLIASAVGFDSARGDSIEVSSIAFSESESLPDLSVGEVMSDYALRFGKPFLNALLIFLFLVMVVRPVVLALIRPKVEGEMLEGLEGLPMGEERLALIEGIAESEVFEAIQKIEDIKAHALQLSEQNMEQAVSIIRQWSKEPEGAKGAKR